MADGIIQPDTHKTKGPGKTTIKLDAWDTEKTAEPTLVEVGTTAPSIVIWTPAFIVIFALTLSIGLSAESLLTQGWLNHYYAGAWISLPHVAIILGLFIAMSVVTRSRWIRMGSIFGCTWAIFAGVNQVLSFYTVGPTSPIPAYVNAAISCALLGSSMCLSIEYTVLKKWDIWFFRLALILAICLVALVYLTTPAANRSLNGIESAIAALALVLSVLVWWLRPACWQAQPGPTFFFGLTPALTLLLSIPAVGVGSTNFFLSQVALLSLLLGTMRVLQGEKKVLSRLTHTA